MKFNVQVKRYFSEVGYVEVDARDEEEASDLVEDMLRNEGKEISWEGCYEVDGAEVESIEE